jgi:hypothetical protein
MASKQLESEHLELFRLLSGQLPAGEVRESESPDFLIIGPESTLGIEHTRVFRPGNDASTPIRALDGNAADIVALAEKKAMAADLPPLWVKLFFSQSIPLRSAERAAIADAVVETIAASLPSVGETVELEYRGRLSAPHPREVDQIIVCRQPERTVQSWRRADAAEIALDTRAEFQSAIESKSKLLEQYREKCDRCWLLIASEFMRPSQAIAPNEATLAHCYQSNFERVYFLDCTERHVTRLRTRQW